MKRIVPLLLRVEEKREDHLVLQFEIVDRIADWFLLGVRQALGGEDEDVPVGVRAGGTLFACRSVFMA